ncbi:MAG TPA: hypothetical protein VN734_17495 [Acidobacteriaceae bacterium]|nr:hypothetical protein [Acidobacteriaceae bacterium]
MADISQLAFHPKWWWDPIDMEIFKNLENNAQRQIVAVSLQTQAEMLKVQAAGLEKIGAALSSQK